MQSRGHKFHRVALWADDDLPDPDTVDGLVIMGGPMNVDEHAAYPWLADEIRFIRAVVDAGKPVLGICLGGQLMARALGAAVRAGGEPEIGWFETRRVARHPLLARVPNRFMAYHWHGDSFDIPAGAERVLESDACANQGFVYGDRALALQCHLETTQHSAQAIIDNTTWQISPTAQSAETMLGADEHFAHLVDIMTPVLAGLFEP